MVKRYAAPAASGVGTNARARTIPSQRLMARPSAWTSTSLAVKSVSGAEVAAHSSTFTGPVISSGASSPGVV